MTERRRWVSHRVPIPGGRLLRHRDTKSWSHGMTNVAIPELNMLENSSTRPVYVPSSSKFNLPLTGTFTWPTPPGPYRATTCRGRELNHGSHTYFFDHTRTWRVSPDEWLAQCRGHLRESTNMKDNTHQAHTQSSRQGEYGMIITTAKWYSGTLGA